MNKTADDNKNARNKPRFIRTLFNPRGWIDFDRVRSGQRYITHLFASFLIPNRQEAVESFEAAQKRMQLTEAQLLTQQNSFLRLAYLMAVAAVFLFVYMLYNLIHAYFLASWVTWIVMLLALGLAFRYHFWYFQIKQRKLGCTIREWFRYGLMGMRDDESTPQS
jgi:intracellular multiplication protein IcmV